MKRNRGITLIALVITIIVLLILVGVTISLVLGDNGLLNRAKESGETYQKEAVREELQLIVTDIEIEQAEKMESLTNEILQQNMQEKINSQITSTLEGNYKGYDFYIEDNHHVVIGKRTSTKLFVTEENRILKVLAIDTEEKIKKIEIINPEGTVLLTKDYVDSIEEKLEQIANVSGIYIIRLTTGQNNIRETSIEIKQFVIRTKADLIEFREMVNSGVTFQKDEIIQVEDIDIGGSTAEQWTSIGNENMKFQGIYNGQNHKISGIYINNSLTYQGVFGVIYQGELKNITIENSYIHASDYVGGLVGMANNTILENCYVENNVQVIGKVHIGGICGVVNNANIRNSYNHATVQSSGNWVGGIGGFINNGSTIDSCYNVGTITGSAQNTGGIAGRVIESTVLNCYNLGAIKGKSDAGGIAGAGEKSSIQNCYNIGTIKATTASGGAMLGYINISSTLKNNYFLTGTASYTVGKSGVTGGTNPSGCTKLVADTLKQQASILNNGQEPEIWITDKEPNLNNGYPILSWQS